MNTGTKVALGVGGYLLVGAAVWAKKTHDLNALCSTPGGQQLGICHTQDTAPLDFASTLLLWPIDLLQMAANGLSKK